MRLYLFTFLTILFFIIIACKKEDEKPSGKDIFQSKNLPPTSFKVTVLEVTYNCATIDWEPSIDPDNDTLYYSIFLNDSLIASKLRIDKIFKFSNLQPLKNYSGKVEVTDLRSDTIFVPFSFTTKKYYVLFNKLFQNTGFSPIAHSIEKTSDGGYIVGGSINSSNGNAYDTYILKLDSLGFEEWNKIYVSHTSGNTKIKQTSDNGFIIVDNVELIKLDSDGNLIWKSTTGFDGNQYNNVVQTSDNGYLVVGVGPITDTVIEPASIIKFNENGTLLWTKYYSKSYRNRFDYIEKAADGNYIILGTRGIDSNVDLFVLKIDINGNFLWDRTYADTRYDFAEQIKLTKDNGFIITGFSLGNLQISEARAVKIDNEGNKIWDNSYSSYGYSTYAYSIVQTNEGGYIFSGNFNLGTFGGTQSHVAILVKLDANGIVSWKKEYKPEYMDFYWICRDLKITNDGGFIIVGNKSWIWSGENKEVGLWVMKTDESGNYK
jgi:hypothetical protein